VAARRRRSDDGGIDATGSEGGGEGAYSDRGDVLMLKVLVVGQGAHGNGGDCSSETSSASGLLRRRRGRGYSA
jgi:hypothetical protein